jgi:hypothetical protein
MTRTKRIIDFLEGSEDAGQRTAEVEEPGDEGKLASGLVLLFVCGEEDGGAVVVVRSLAHSPELCAEATYLVALPDLGKAAGNHDGRDAALHDLEGGEGDEAAEQRVHGSAVEGNASEALHERERREREEVVVRERSLLVGQPSV